MPPAIIREAAERFDELVLRTVLAVCDLPWPDGKNNTHLAITLPFRFDGMGLPPHTRRSPAAYWTSWAASAHDVRSALFPDRASDEIMKEMRDTDAYFHLHDTYEKLKTNGITTGDKKHKSYFPTDFIDFWFFYGGTRSPKSDLQHHLSFSLDWTHYLRSPHILPITATYDQEDERDDDGQPLPPRRDTTSLIFTTMPTTADTNIKTRDYQYALKHRFNFPVGKHSPSTCPFCHASIIDEPSHAHSCPKFKRKAVNNRHEMLVKAIIAHANRAGMVASYQPRAPDAQGRRTMPDALIVAHHRTVMIDVSCVSMYAKSNVNNVNRIAVRERQKVAKFGECCKARGYDFIPAVFDTGGRFGAGVWRIISIIVTGHNNSSQPHNPHLRDSIARSLAVLLQRGNAEVDAYAMQFHRQPSGPLLRHPSLPPLAARALPDTIHDTLTHPPASIDDIPGHRLPSSSSLRPSPSSRPDGDSESKEEPEQQQRHHNGSSSNSNEDGKRSGNAPTPSSLLSSANLTAHYSSSSSSLSSSPTTSPPSSSSSSSTSSSSRMIDVLLPQNPSVIADSSSSLSSSSLSPPSSSAPPQLPRVLFTALPRTLPPSRPPPPDPPD